jgi:hypothetical protein
MALFFAALISVALYTLYKVLDDTEDEKAKKRFRSKSGSDFRSKMRKNASFTRARRLGAILNVTIAHNIILNFVLPTITLPHLPMWLRNGISSLLRIKSIDISQFMSSPECQWQFNTYQMFAFKWTQPVALVIFFFGSWMFATRHIFKRMNPNRVVGLAAFIFITTTFPVCMHSVFLSWDCTWQEDAQITRLHK